MLPSVRRGVVAKDPAIRLEHMTVIGYLARDLPTSFPSFAALYDRLVD